MNLNKEDKDLIILAENTIKKARKLNEKNVSGVGSALITSKGNKYIGISIEFDCGLDSCGEYQAIGNMLTNGENNIKTIVATYLDKKVLPPYGKCREMIYQVNKSNLDTLVIISKSKKVKLRELLPLRWQEVWK